MINMNFAELVVSANKFLSLAFPPRIKKGMRTEHGLRLQNCPSLSDDPKVKFAAWDDSRFWMPEHYKKFENFIPKEFQIIGPPVEGQNCFGYALGFNQTLDRREFTELLGGHDWVGGSVEDLAEGDVVAYFKYDPDIDGFNHAGIYVGNGRIRDRSGQFAGFGGPLIEHPIAEILPPYYDPQIGIQFSGFRKKN